MTRQDRFGLAAVLIATLSAAPAGGMLRTVAVQNWVEGPIVNPEDAGRESGFDVAAGVTELADTQAPAVFDAVDAGDWQAVIRLLETLDQGEQTTLIRDNSGMLRPLSTLKAQVMADLPPEGRRTFRMMYRPVAVKMLADAQGIADPAQQSLALAEVVERYGLCAAASEAAQQLGDLHFEGGRFNESARYYAFASEHPVGDPDDAQLIAKRLHAFARSGDWAGFDTLADYARFRRGGASVRVGGETVTVNALIDVLGTDRANGPAIPQHVGRPLGFPRGAYPSAEIQVLSPSIWKIVQHSMMNQRVAPSADELTRPVALMADGRLYTLALGQLTAHAPETGEPLWAAGNAEESARQVSNWSNQLALSGIHQSLSLQGDTLLATAHDPQQMDMARLYAYDKATGDLRWSSQQVAELMQVGFLGEPATRGRTTYAVTKERNGNRLVLYALDLDDGSPQWSVQLGEAKPDPNWRQVIGLSPCVAVGERYIFVLTNNGALIAVDPVRQEVAWAMSYGILPASNPNTGQVSSVNPGGIAVQDGVVYSKDGRDDRLVAIRASDAVVQWTTQVDAGSTLVHSDRRHAYLLGDELVAYDLATGERVWWTSHHGRAGRAPAFTADYALIAGPHRMCRIDLTTGKVDGYREDIPAGSGGSEVIQLDRGIAVVGSTGLLIYDTQNDD